MIRTAITCFILLWTISKISHAQDSGSAHRAPIIKELQQPDSQGKVQIIQDRRIDSLLVKYVSNNQKKQTIPGFRIRIFSANNQDNGRQRATETKAKFIASFPNSSEEIYIIYESPDWKVYVGNFRTRTDAFRLKKQIESVFPNNRLVESQVEYNKL